MRKLLIVDDDAAIRRLMKIELGDTYEVIDSGEPEEGLALALEHRPDAILLDLRMPTYSGYELLQTFGSYGRTQGVPIIVVSGEAGAQTKEHCKNLGAVMHFEKPVDFDSLRTFLTHSLKKQHRYLPRAEVRVNLSVPLKIRGTDKDGKVVEGIAKTEQVSLSGFQVRNQVEYPRHSTWDIFMQDGNRDLRVGRAQVVEVNEQSGLRQYFFRFLERTEHWVLQ